MLTLLNLTPEQTRELLANVNAAALSVRAYFHDAGVSQLRIAAALESQAETMRHRAELFERQVIASENIADSVEAYVPTNKT